MAKSTRQYVFDGTEILHEALIPFVKNRLESALSGHWQVQVAEKLRLRPDRNGDISWDLTMLLNAMDRFWADAFKVALGRAERSLVNELAAVRNKLSHNESFTYDDAERALDSMRRLTEAISAGEASTQLGAMRDTILRTRFAERQRNEERRGIRRTGIAVEATGDLPSWREVVEPHPDVATGDFQQAEFAADLGKVHAGRAPAEYGDPHEFFGRTYLTDGLKALLVGVAKRLAGSGGDPVVELQTNFGGGKTHSMLALYHMAGPTPVEDLPGLDQLLSGRGVAVPEGIKRAVLVGTARGPLETVIHDGPEIRTTWGEMAWQLGGAAAFDRISENDAKGIAPGSNLLEAIFRDCAPCLVLIDEWVAYLRQIYKTDGLPSGSFDANLSFVQSLTEAVKTSPGTALVATLPASQIEVGGEGGEAALERLQQTFSRIESSWLPASQEESYEIVRRRLFKEVPGDKFPHRDNTLKHFSKLYRDNANEFPRGSDTEAYRRKMEMAYPIHPELFDQLYTSWGTLERFQRTRGVLRLMAQAVHQLWMEGDPSAMIMPGSIAVGSERVEPELLHYLDVNWQSIIAGDVDGPTSIPYKIDESAPNLNRRSATRRIARAIFMGTAPVHQQRNKGLDVKQINLGVVQPGERPSIFGDALRRLGDQAKFLHSNLDRYWYSTSPSLNRMATERAESIEEERVLMEVDKQLAAYINGLDNRGHFDAVQVAPTSSRDLPDEAGGARAVILGVAHPHNGQGESAAITTARDMLSQHGSVPRVHRNVPVFLAADAQHLELVKSAVRFSLAWGEIVQDTERFDLTQSESARAKEQRYKANQTVMARLQEAWRCLLYPTQNDAEADVEWTTGKVSAQDGLLRSASKKLVDEEGLLPELGPERLDRELRKYLWNDKDHLSLKDLWEYVNRHVYLPRLKDRSVLVKTVSLAVNGTVPGPFAYAESWDEVNQAYQGLAIEDGGSTQVVIDRESLIVRPDVAEASRRVFISEPQPVNQPTPVDDDGLAAREAKPASRPTRFLGTVMISPDRPAKDFHRIVEGVIEQLATLPGSEVSLKLEVDAEMPSGLDQTQTRTLVENANTLGFIEKTLK